MNTPSNPQPFFSVIGLLKTLAPFDSKVVGTFHPEMLKLFPENPKAGFLEFIDEFSHFAKSDNQRAYPTGLNVHLSSGKTIRMQNVSRGSGNSYGDVYRMDAGGEPLAVKVFFDRPYYSENFLLHGPVAETRTDLYLCDGDYKDYRKFYLSDIGHDKGWAIGEFIDKVDSRKKAQEIYDARSGKEVFKAHKGLANDDNKNYTNLILHEQILIDPGGIYHKHMQDSFDAKAITELYPLTRSQSTTYSEPNPFIRWIMFAREEEKEAAFFELLSRKNTNLRHDISEVIPELPEYIRTKAYYALLEHPNTEARTKLDLQIKHLPKQDALKALLDTIDSPNIQISSEMFNIARKLFPKDELQPIFTRINEKIFSRYKRFSIDCPPV